MKHDISIFSLLRAWWPAVLLVVLGESMAVLGWFDACPSLDIPMHFLGGLLVAFAIVRVFAHLPEGSLPRSRWSRIVYIVALTAIVTILWETYEWAQDTFLGRRTQLGIPDTMLDLWLGLLGGFAYAWYKVKR